MKSYLKALVVVAILSAGFYFGFSIYQKKLKGNKNRHQILDQMETSGAPLFSGSNIYNESYSLVTPQSKIIIINFWASWCAPCVEEFPSLMKLVEHYKGQVRVIAVSQDSTQEDIQTFLNSIQFKNNSDFQIVWDQDGSIGQKYQVNRLPESFILGSDLKLRRKVIGTIDWANSDALGYFDIELKK